MVENISQIYFCLHKHEMIPHNLNVVRVASGIHMEKQSTTKNGKWAMDN